MNDDTRTPSPATGSAVPASTVAPVAWREEVGFGQYEYYDKVPAPEPGRGYRRFEPLYTATVAPSSVGEVTDAMVECALRTSRLFGYDTHESVIGPNDMRNILKAALAAQAPKPASGGGEWQSIVRDARSLLVVLDDGRKKGGKPTLAEPLTELVLRRIVAIAAEADTAKEGWVLVPREMTIEMMGSAVAMYHQHGITESAEDAEIIEMFECVWQRVLREAATANQEICGRCGKPRSAACGNDFIPMAAAPRAGG